MSEFENDIEKTNDLLKSKSVKINRPYFNSNENLKKIFDNFDISDKNILTVVGSGDQAFYFYDRGAKHVDLFDKNKLAIYYFYLRIWFIEYCDKFYPDYEISNHIILDLLKRVVVKSINEKNAYNYWKKFASIFSEEDTQWMFNPTTVGINYNYMKDLCNVKKRLSDRNFNIYCVDISKNIINGKKYDIIFKSNISDYVRSDNYSFYLDNLDQHLSDGGIIVSTNVLFGCPKYEDMKVFSSRFNIQEMPYIYDVQKEREISPGYIYTRK